MSKTQTATNPAYTSGPWRVADHKDKRHHEYAIMADHGGIDGEGGKVASVWAGFGTHFDWVEAKANAHLIESAPDMLAALESLCGVYDGYDDVPLYVTKARAAIAKARGSK